MRAHLKVICVDMYLKTNLLDLELRAKVGENSKLENVALGLAWMEANVGKDSTGPSLKYHQLEANMVGFWQEELTPDNVCEALSTLRPHGIDVSSGICASDEL
ncbi:hypothetical protein HYC85_000882 [Camellia sinensis]|uniref:Uncharacterized protein n=1 Tax=Camellia sinensis TaxID=4442 RepID=A0A7J7I3R1_CAMSI|nr:hypothetical protein HYC85_000882 [Camellia sinensis]